MLTNKSSHELKMQVVNKSQQVVTAGMAPKASYSRVIGVVLAVEPDGAWRYAATQQIGQEFWLLGVTVTFCPKVVNQDQWTEFVIKYGQAETANPDGLAGWDVVIPIWDQAGIVRAWRCYDGRDEYSWEMKRRYVGQAGKLAIVAMRPLNWGEDILQVSFHVSEG